MNATFIPPLAVSHSSLEVNGIPDRDLAFWHLDSAGALAVVYWLSDGEVSSVPRHKMALPALHRG